jgi:hypothetical protein
MQGNFSVCQARGFRYRDKVFVYSGDVSRNSSLIACVDLMRNHASRLFELARVLVRFQSLCPLHHKRESRHHVSDCTTSRSPMAIRFSTPQATESNLQIEARWDAIRAARGRPEKNRELTDKRLAAPKNSPMNSIRRPTIQSNSTRAVEILLSAALFATRGKS